MTLTPEELDQLWLDSGGDDLLDGANFQSLYESLENNSQAFEISDRSLRCIDEGTPDGIHMAGSGILYPNAAVDLQGKIDGIYSHENCGAAKIYTSVQGVVDGNPDEVGDKKAQELAQKLQVPYLGRIKAYQMKRPPSIHNARVVYYDGTGHFNPANVEGLPAGFVISRAIISDVEYAKTEVKVSIGIALGDHGFGMKFTENSPLYLVAVSDSALTSVPLDLLITELNSLKNDNRIKIDSIKGK